MNENMLHRHYFHKLGRGGFLTFSLEIAKICIANPSWFKLCTIKPQHCTRVGSTWSQVPLVNQVLRLNEAVQTKVERARADSQHVLSAVCANTSFGEISR